MKTPHRQSFACKGRRLYRKMVYRLSADANICMTNSGQANRCIRPNTTATSKKMVCFR